MRFCAKSWVVTLSRPPFRKCVVAALLSGGYVGAAHATEYPCAQVRLVVPYPVGGATDVAARVVADRLETQLKRTVVIESRPGATGNIGTVAVTTAKPDGCTLLVNAAVIGTFKYSFSKLGYDPVADLVAVGGIGVTPTMLVTATANPISNVNDLVRWSHEKPGGLTFSTAGYGLLQHLAAEEIGVRTGAKFNHIGYKGGASAVTDLITARVDFGSFASGSIGPFLKDKQLKAIGLIADKRSAIEPDVPTIKEQGIAGIESGVQFLMFAPAGTPRDIVVMLSDELRKIVSDPALKERFYNVGFEPTPMGPDETADIVRQTGETWAPLIKRLNIRLD